MCVFTPAAVAYTRKRHKGHRGRDRRIHGVSKGIYMFSYSIALSIVNHAGKLNGNDSSTTFLETSVKTWKTKHQVARVSARCDERTLFVATNHDYVLPLFRWSRILHSRIKWPAEISSGDANVSHTDPTRLKDFRRRDHPLEWEQASHLYLEPLPEEQLDD